jgi:integrase/transcription elongation factor Elf1
MIKINWHTDYQREFQCPRCQKIGVRLGGNLENKKKFRCPDCNKEIIQFYSLTKTYFSNILAGYGFACPNEKCNARQMVLYKTIKGKKHFKCKVCRATTVESCDLTRSNLSRYAQRTTYIKTFCFEDDEWDLRAINNSTGRKNSGYIVNFNSFQCNWFKSLSKKYIYYLCKLNKPWGTIDRYVTGFRQFSTYLVDKNILNLEKINRDLIIDFIAWNNSSNCTTTNRLRSLGQLFITGNIQGWFYIDPDLIQDSDYPKQKLSNPDPIPDPVREQIEKNLHKLPDPIARMWIVCFFAAMRPQELALLKKNCLEQVGDKWKLIWWRKKGKKIHQHSVPITRTIAKVVQEQREYIEELWGQDWEHLFCHYQNISQLDPTHPRLKPVKKVIPSSWNPLRIAIRTLIKAENIRDDNGQLAKFQPRLLRETRLTELFQKGHDLSVVSAWAGHKRLATTANFYTQVTCQQIEKEVGHIQSALVNAEGKKLYYESMPKSFWENPVAHELEVAGTHVNTPIYGYCGLDLDEECDKFRACYTCRFFVPKPEKLPQYIKQRDELREKQEQALASGHDVLVEQFGRQADQLDKIILSLQEVA